MDVTPIPKRGKRARNRKQRADMSELALVRHNLLARSGTRCEAKVPALVCTQVGTMAHHKLRRSQGGTNEPANLMWVCASCHDWIHANPAVSYDLGYLIPRGAA